MCFQLQDKKGKVLLNGEHLTWRELRKALPEVFAVYGLIGVRLNSLYFTVIQRNQLAAFLFRYRRLPMRSSKLLLHLIACCCVVSTRMANGQVSCPVDSTPLEFGGYSDKHKCVSFVPKDRIPKCGRLLHECLEQFCATEFSGGHLMNWDPNDIADIPQVIFYDKFRNFYDILNGKILLNRVAFVDRRRGQRGAWTNFDCMNFQTFCGLGCPPVEHCSWYTNPLHYHFGGWYDYLFISDFLKDMRMQKEQKRLSWVKLPACRNLILYRDRKETPKIYGLYECQEANFDYFACQHKKYPACSMKKEKNCHYSPEHNECRLWKYTIIVPPSKYGIPCEKQSEEKCECPCSGEPQEWQPWSATCGVMTRSRVRPKNPGRADCKQLPEACCTEEETKVGEDCKNYAYNTGINLRTTGCVNGTKGVDANDHLECVCDPGFTGVLCDIVVDNCVSNPCENGATCESVKGIFVCHCTSGWTGVLCEKKRKECREGTCLNGGTCVENANTFLCECPATHGGDFCEYAVSWCTGDTCNGRGLCANITSLRTWKCYCFGNFSGSRCDRTGQLAVQEFAEVRLQPSVRIWIIVLLVLSALIFLLCIGAGFTAAKRARDRWSRARPTNRNHGTRSPTRFRSGPSKWREHSRQ